MRVARHAQGMEPTMRKAPTNVVKIADAVGQNISTWD
jgi:hypothetical protein